MKTSWLPAFAPVSAWRVVEVSSGPAPHKFGAVILRRIQKEGAAGVAFDCYSRGKTNLALMIKGSWNKQVDTYFGPSIGSTISGLTREWAKNHATLLFTSKTCGRNGRDVGM